MSSGGGDSKQYSDEYIQAQDHYISENGIEQAAKKNADVAERMQSVVEFIRSNESQIPAAAFHLMIGRCFNILPDFSEESEVALSRAVKLDPDSADAWSELGEMYCKKGETKLARNCFEDALKRKDKIEILRNLSMVLRQVGDTMEERAKNIQESIVLAKRASEMDLNNGRSWLILGNAYLAQFCFSLSNKRALLTYAMSAYTKAEEDKVLTTDPDLHFNRGMLLLYVSEYQAALDDFKKASDLDPPWPEPKKKIASVIAHLTKLKDMLSGGKNVLRPKKIASLISSLSDADLGPYANQIKKSDGTAIQLVKSGLTELEIGANEAKVVLSKVVGSIHLDDDLCQTVLIVDEANNSMLAALFNLSDKSIVKPGDTICIGAPQVLNVDVSHSCEDEAACRSFQFRLIRVESPLELVVNSCLARMPRFYKAKPNVRKAIQFLAPPPPPRVDEGGKEDEAIHTVKREEDSIAPINEDDSTVPHITSSISLPAPADIETPLSPPQPPATPTVAAPVNRDRHSSFQHNQYKPHIPPQPRTLDSILASAARKRNRSRVSNRPSKKIPADLKLKDFLFFNPDEERMKRNPKSHIVASSSIGGSEVKSERGAPNMPKVKVDAEGNIVLDEDSMVIDAKQEAFERLEAMDTLYETDGPINTTNCTSFRPKTCHSRWTKIDTEKFYVALGSVGTDFTLIKSFFPHHSQSAIRRKFNNEDKKNHQLITELITNKRYSFNPLLLSTVLDCTDKVLDSKQPVKKSKDVKGQFLDSRARLHGNKRRKQLLYITSEDEEEDDIVAPSPKKKSKTKKAPAAAAPGASSSNVDAAVTSWWLPSATILQLFDPNLSIEQQNRLSAGLPVEADALRSVLESQLNCMNKESAIRLAKSGPNGEIEVYLEETWLPTKEEKLHSNVVEPV